MKKILLILFCFLAACGSKSGGGSTPTDPTDPAVNSLNISLNKEEIYFGLVDTSNDSMEQEVIVTGTNPSGDANVNFEVDGDSNDFSIAPGSECSGSFQEGQTCSVKIKFSPTGAGLKTLTVTAKTATEEKSLSLLGIGGDYESRISGLRINLVDAQSADGSWQDSIDFDFFGTQMISKTLLQLDAKIGLPGLFTQAGTGVLDYTQEYLSLKDNDTLIDFVADQNVQVTTWDLPRDGPDGLFVDEIQFSLLDTLNLFNEKQGFFGGDYLAQFSNYVDSRRLSGNVSSAAAQYAFYVSEGSDRYGNGNYHRILNDITILMESLMENGETVRAQEMAQVIYQNYWLSANELRVDNTVNLSYNIEPFVFNNPGDYEEVDQDDAILDKVFDNPFDCRIHGEALLLLSKAYQAGGFSEADRLDILDELTVEWDYFNEDHSAGDFLGGACKPVRARISMNLPEEIRDIPQISVIYLDLLDEIDDGDEINDFSPFLIGETLKALEENLFY